MVLRDLGGWRAAAAVCRTGAGVSLLVCALATSGCDQKPVAAAPAPPPAVVTVAQPVTRPVQDEIIQTGKTAALNTVDIRARVTGYLFEDHVPKEMRAMVKKGDLLYLIDPRPFKNSLDQSKADLAAVDAQLEQAQTDLDKVERLLPKGAASQDELLAAKSKRDTLSAQIDAAKARIATNQLNLDFCSVTAPMSGFISRTIPSVGSIILADQTVLSTIVEGDPIYAYFYPSERQLLEIRASQAVRTGSTEPGNKDVPVFLALMNETGFPHEGRIDYVAPSVDPTTGTIEVRAVFPNPKGLLVPGLFVRLRIPLGEPAPAILVAERAFGSDQGQKYLLVVNDKRVVEYRPVTVGSQFDGLRQVLSGLRADEWVIVNGMQRVRPGVTVNPTRSDMSASPAAASPPASAPAAK